MDKTQVRQQLRSAVQTLSFPGLRRSATWCAELLQNFSDDIDDISLPPAKLHDDLALLTDSFLVGKCYFDQQEYDRCAHCLESLTTKPNFLEYFLWAYSLYLSGERRKEEAIREGNSEG
jgi:hypothetical protein